VSVPALRSAVREQYERYVTTVSDAAHAISLELALFMLEIAVELQPKRLLDLGSGFSSYVFRTYAQASGGCEVWSVDHDANWLEQTGQFLISCGLPTDRMMPWEAFRAGLAANGDSPGFELVLHDMETVESRIATLQHALALVQPGGAMVVDDMDVDDYREATRALVASTGASYEDVREATLDERLRYSWVIRP
jgi:predicted O-methyltransferase YrrM